MPRHTTSRTGLAAPSINLLPASLIHFHDSSNSGTNVNSNTSRAALSRRRHILKHIPQIETPDTTPSALLQASPGSSPTSSIAANLGELGAKVGSSLPVVRAGATFLSTLSHSVALSASDYTPSAPPSPCLFPQYASPPIPTATAVRRRLSITMSANTASAPPATEARALPSLDFVPVTTEEERVDGLKLVADSIAQRRQMASMALMTHPFFMGAMVLAFSAVYKWLYRDASDWALIFTTCMGMLMAGFVAIRWAVSGYINLAESINYKWLDDDEIVIARWGDGEDRKVIGSVVYRVEKASGSGNGRKGRKIASIRAWTTRLRMRGNGVGKGLVEEMVRQAKAKGVEDIRWEDGNVYETRILPKWANGGFEEGLKEARKKLEGYVKELNGKK